MTDQTNTKECHALICFHDTLGNLYYEESLFSEEECKHIQSVLDSFSGKKLFDMLPEEAKTFATKLLGIASKTIANACMNDFDRATKLLVDIRKQNIDDDEINEKISTAIKDLAELKQQTPPFAISPATAQESIATAFTYMPPLKGIFIKTYTPIKWDYINKRRSADYGNI